MADLKQISDSPLVVLFARLVLPLMLSIGTPVVGYLIVRSINTVDAQSQKLDDHTITLTTIKGEFKAWHEEAKSANDRMDQTLTDHETRIRVLEHTPPH